VKGNEVVELMEITMNNLLSAGDIDLHDFLARADLLATAGKTVLISDYSEYYRLAAYLTRYTNEPIAVTMGVGSLKELFEEQYYSGLEGGILEAFGKLFTKNLRIYVYPLLDKVSGQLITAENVAMPADQCNLYRHLVERGRIKQQDNFDRRVLHIFSRDVLKRIKENDASWEEMVPQDIADAIKRRHFFGYREASVGERVLAGSQALPAERVA
jgi:polyhydroxyalkanoate synthesis regulator phasin